MKGTGSYILIRRAADDMCGEGIWFAGKPSINHIHSFDTLYVHMCDDGVHVTGESCGRSVQLYFYRLHHMLSIYLPITRTPAVNQSGYPMEMGHTAYILFKLFLKLKLPRPLCSVDCNMPLPKHDTITLIKFTIINATSVFAMYDLYIKVLYSTFKKQLNILFINKNRDMEILEHDILFWWYTLESRYLIYLLFPLFIFSITL